MPHCGIVGTLPGMNSAADSRYSCGEEIANSVTHGIGWVLSSAGLGLIVTLAALNGHATEVVSVTVFGLTLIVLYAVSTLYHAFPDPRSKRVLRALDHSAIYLLIAGTYTPIALAVIRGTIGWTLFGIIWGLAGVGVVATSLGIRGIRWVEMTLYVSMGWMVIGVAKHLIAVLDPVPMWLLVTGGLAYTSGLAFYGWKKLPYGHMVWHLFVLAGSVLHFLAVLFAVAVAT